MRTTKVGAGAVLICLTLGVSACGGGGGASTTTQAANGKTSGTITLWARDTEKAFINVLADAYNKNHGAKVKVTIVPSGNFVQKLALPA
jgi:multiple sugar transport system substrate-binding protein